jgi:hypothetical protein
MNDVRKMKDLLNWDAVMAARAVKTNVSTIGAPPVEAFLNNPWAIFCTGDACFTRDEMRKHVGKIDDAAEVRIPDRCQCGKRFAAHMVCCANQKLVYKLVGNREESFVDFAALEEAIERSKTDVALAKVKFDIPLEPKEPPAPRVKTDKTAPKIENPLRKEELDQLAASFDFEETGTREPQPYYEFLPVEPLLVAHLLTVGVNLYFTYPQDELDKLVKLFESRERKLHIRPLAEPRPTTTTVRGGCSASITFARPANMAILDRYPKAKECGGPSIVLHDFKLALQLHLDHGFTLGGSSW